MAAKRSDSKAEASDAARPKAQTRAAQAPVDRDVQAGGTEAGADAPEAQPDGTADDVDTPEAQAHGTGEQDDDSPVDGGQDGRDDADRGAEADPTATRLQELERETADLRDRLARARADYQNLQRRVERDAVLARERVKARFLEDFLQVYEYGQMAAFEAERNPGPLADGVKMVVREFDRLLEKEGVERLGQAGEPFDRAVHEAVTTEAADGVAPGHVSRVVAPGYRLGERILRFAKVAVAPGDEDEE